MKPSPSRLNLVSSRPLRRVTSRPATTIWPAVARSMVAMQLSSVDLPLPLGPITAKNSPAGTLRSTPASACVVTPLLPKTFSRRLISKAQF